MLLYQKQNLPRGIVFRRSYNTLGDDNTQNVVVIQHYEDENMNPLMLRRAEDVISDIPAEYDVEEVLQNVEEVRTPLHQEEVVPVNIPAVTPPKVVAAVNDEVAMPTLDPQDQTYNLRPNRARPGRWAGLLADSKRVFGLQYSTGQKAYNVAKLRCLKKCLKS
jgi:hypothetical protein